MYLRRIFLYLIIWYLLLEVICYAFACGKIPVLKEGHRSMPLKGSEEHQQQRIKNTLIKWAQKMGLFIISGMWVA